MTASRRSRRTPPLSAPEERLRTLGLDASPAARRLRARIPRASSEPAPGVSVPRAPYAVGEAETPYLLEAPYRPDTPSPRPGRTGHWSSPSPPGPLWNGAPASPAPAESATSAPAKSDAADEWALETAPTVRLRPDARTALPEHESPPPQSPWKEPPLPEGDREEHTSSNHGDGGSGRDSVDSPDNDPGRAPDPPPKNQPEEAASGRHRRRPEAVRPPSGYTELDPEAPGSVLDRAAERWVSHASLSRRAVVTLLVLGLLAVAGTFLALRERPGEVTVPELVNQAAPASQDPDDPASAGADGGGEAPGGAGGGSDAAEPDGDVVVHVGGEVAEPGLYTMPAGSRVADAVEEAGGPLPEADLDLVNLARTLTDGERVLVGVPQPEGGSGDGQAGSAGSGSLVNLNLAGQAELETLPGIGQKKAQQILTHREALGGSFSSIEDLLGVDGIAEKTFKTLEPHVTVG